VDSKAMSTEVFYNNVLMSEVRITEYRVDSPAGFDQPSTGILHHHVAGEALVFSKTEGDGMNPDGFRTKVLQGLNQPRQALRIKVTDQVGSYTLIDTTTLPSNPDEAHGPFVRASVTHITGTKCLLVNFTIEWAECADSTNTIRSFYCNSVFSIDEIGNTTIRKTGSLQTKAETNYTGTSVAPLNTDRAGSSNTGLYSGDAVRSDVITDYITSNGIGGGKYADCYRRFVSGNLFPGFRRMRQEYAVDESRTRLLFDIVDQEFTRGLPAPAKVGNCSFTFEREIGTGSQAIGTKHFISSVKGDRYVTAGALLTLCIRMSQNRIDYARDLIQKIRVTEENMLTDNAITFEVIALATSAQSFSPSNTEESQSSGGGSLIDQSLLLKNILSPISFPNGPNFQFVPAQQPEAYGNSLIVRVTPYAYDHQSVQTLNAPSMSLPSTYQMSSESAQPVIYLFPRGWFDGVPEQADEFNNYIPKNSPALAVPTGPNKGDLEKNKQNQDGSPVVSNPNFSSKAGKKVKVNTGILVVPSVCPQGKPRVFQIGSPVAEITEFIDGARKNEAPARDFGEKEVGSFVSVMGYSFTSGVPDVNGNRVMVAGFDRTTVLASPGDFNEAGVSPTNPAFKIVDANFAGSTFPIVAFNPTEIKMPIDETQGEDQPKYTSGLGAEEGYLA
jgi:hypothetical protein